MDAIFTYCKIQSEGLQSQYINDVKFRNNVKLVVRFILGGTGKNGAGNNER